MIETKDILNWCFTVAALVFGVFGFLYSTYAAANFQATPDRPARPAIVKFLRVFCWAIALVLVVLTSLAAVASYEAGVGPQTWTIVGCFVVLTCFSVWLVIWMD
jgi:hypothetical protein